MARPEEDGRAVLVADGEGNDKTPSLVYFGDDETLVGSDAVDVLTDARGDPLVHARAVRSIKRRLLSPPRIALPGDRVVTPVQVAGEIFAKLKRDAEASDHGQPVQRVVVAYPAVFGTAQVSVITEAATRAGFDEVELVEEPVLAALAFERAGGQVGQGVLVFDFGGGTFDVAFVVREEGEDRFDLALEPDGDAQCGGDDLDQALYDYFDQQARRELGRPIALDADTIDSDFLRTCRRRKENLSKSRQATFSTMLDGGVRFTSTIDRDQFEQLIATHIDRTITLTDRTVQRARDEGYQVDTVLLVGGSSQVPVVRRRIEQQLGLRPQQWKQRDVAVALGAAHHAHQLWGRPVRTPAKDPRQRYRRAVELVWSDHRLEAAEARQLDAFRRELGLHPDDAATIERDIIGHTKHNHPQNIPTSEPDSTPVPDASAPASQSDEAEQRTTTEHSTGQPDPKPHTSPAPVEAGLDVSVEAVSGLRERALQGEVEVTSGDALASGSTDTLVADLGAIFAARYNDKRSEWTPPEVSVPCTHFLGFRSYRGTLSVGSSVVRFSGAHPKSAFSISISNIKSITSNHGGMALVLKPVGAKAHLLQFVDVDQCSKVRQFVVASQLASDLTPALLRAAHTALNSQD